MNPTTRSIAYAVLALLAVYVWGNCRESAGASKQRLRDSTTVVDRHSDSTDRRVAMLAAESLELGGKLRRFARNDSVARGEIARLKARVPRAQPDTTGRVGESLSNDVPSPSGCAGAPTACDSIIDAQDSVIASQDSQLTIWRALAVERGELLQRTIQERDAYRRIAIAWQQKAEPGLLTKAVRAIPYVVAGVVLAKVIR